MKQKKTKTIKTNKGGDTLSVCIFQVHYRDTIEGDHSPGEMTQGPSQIPTAVVWANPPYGGSVIFPLVSTTLISTAVDTRLQFDISECAKKKFFLSTSSLMLLPSNPTRATIN